MGRQFLLELIPYRGTGRLYLFSLSTAELLFFSHQINKTIQYSRVAVQDITTTDSFGIIVGNGLSPFLIASGVTPIPVLKLDGVGTKIRELEKQKQEEENSQIVQAVRSLKLTPAELMAFLNDPKNSLAASGHNGPKPEAPEKEDTAHEEN